MKPATELEVAFWATSTISILTSNRWIATVTLILSLILLYINLQIYREK